jgi:hypothetical protein
MPPTQTSTVPLSPTNSEASCWTPPAGLREFSSKIISPNTIFFAAPPPEIGEITSAESNWLPGKSPRTLAARGLIAFLAALPALAGAVASTYARTEVTIVLLPFALIIAAACAWYAFDASESKFYCSYIGKLGAARYAYLGPAKSPKAEILVFAQAAGLRTSQTRHFTNGMYSHTDYIFTWSGAAGVPDLVIKGKYRSEKGRPKDRDPYYFPLAAEVAWSEYLLDRAADELARKGFLRFNLSRYQAVRVGPGFIEFAWDGETQRFLDKDIGKFTLEQGTFRIHHKDAKWFSAAGKYSFLYGEMPNAKLFLLALDRFLKIG